MIIVGASKHSRPKMLKCMLAKREKDRKQRLCTLRSLARKRMLESERILWSCLNMSATVHNNDYNAS